MEAAGSSYLSSSMVYSTACRVRSNRRTRMAAWQRHTGPAAEQRSLKASAAVRHAVEWCPCGAVKTHAMGVRQSDTVCGWQPHQQ